MEVSEEKEEKLALYLVTLWNEIQGIRKKGVTNTILSEEIGWAYSEIDYISRYSAEMGYTEVRLGDEVFFTYKGAKEVKKIGNRPLKIEAHPIKKVKPKPIKVKVEPIKIKKLEVKEKYTDLVELADIEEVIEVEESIDTSWVSTTVSWVKGLFSK